MHRKTLAAAAALASLWTFGCVDGGFTSRESVVESRDLEPGGRFELENVNGRVDVATWDLASVKIEAEKAAAGPSALRNVRVEIDGSGSRVKVRTRLPRGPWLFGSGGKVDYRITVPSGAEVTLKNVNGAIHVDGLSGELRAATTNGGVRVEAAGGAVNASTVNGSITAAYEKWAGEEANRFTTVNGSITISLPEGAGGRLEAQTVNGSVDNGLRLATTDRVTRRRIEGRLGPGHARLEASTVNGSIHLRR
jgi:DUF4097 and DUF4098 domain-containing protein YvlB